MNRNARNILNLMRFQERRTLCVSTSLSFTVFFPSVCFPYRDDWVVCTKIIWISYSVWHLIIVPYVYRLCSSLPKESYRVCSGPRLRASQKQLNLKNTKITARHQRDKPNHCFSLTWADTYQYSLRRGICGAALMEITCKNLGVVWIYSLKTHHIKVRYKCTAFLKMSNEHNRNIKNKIFF